MSTLVNATNFGINGWGPGATFSVDPNSTLNRGKIVVTAKAGGVQSPYIVFTYPTPYPLAPLSIAQQVDGSGAISDLAVTTTSNFAVYIWGGFPLSGNTYTFNYDVLGI